MRTSHVSLTRSRLVASGGVVACGHPLAAEIGCRVLIDGGNAVDAVIAAAFASFVVEPAQCGIGGHGRMSIHLARSGRTIGIDHFIRAPSQATPEMYQAALAKWRGAGRDGSDGLINTTGHLAVGVPGAIAGLCVAQKRFATRSLAALMTPAIDIARSGITVDQRMAAQTAQRAAEIRLYPEAAAHLLRDGLPLRPPSWHAGVQRIDASALAATLQQIARHGARAFYDGKLAAAIAQEMQANHGLLTAADLAAYRPHVFEQPRFQYRGTSYVTCGDLIATEALNILEHFDLAALGPASAQRYHLIAEAMGQAFVDNFTHAGDPAHLAAPLDGLASKRYAASQAARITHDRARDRITPGDPWPEQRRSTAPEGAIALPPLAGTTQICAADREGNVAALITSLGSAFGSLVMVPETGIMLGNAMQWFDPRPGKLNSVGPGRMPLYAAPVLIAFDGARALGAIVGSGGYRIQAAVLNPLLAIVDHGMTAQAAVEHPRIHGEGASIDIDSRVAPATRAALQAMGHAMRILDPSDLGGGLGRCSMLWRADGDEWETAAEPWSGGAAGHD